MNTHLEDSFPILANNNIPRGSLSSQSRNKSLKEESKSIFHLKKESDPAYWFQWNSKKVYLYNYYSKQWNLLEQTEPAQQFLYFSSQVATPYKEVFIIGGLDNQQCSSKKILQFSDFRFINKAPMLTCRAFFPGTYLPLDHSIFVFGGSDNGRDLSECQQYSIAENKWRNIAPMKITKNGAASCLIEQTNKIYIIGGNNSKIGEIAKIERYEIYFDRWTVIEKKIGIPSHDMSAIPISSSQILLFGGNNIQKGDINKVELITVQSRDTSSLKQMQRGGKIYLPVMYEEEKAQIHLFTGYPDQSPQHQSYKLEKVIPHWMRGRERSKLRRNESLGFLN